MTDEKNGRNAKQDIAIVSIKKDVERLTDEVSDIKKWVTNDIPHSIEILRKEINELKLAQTRQFVGLLISIVGLLIAVIVNMLV